MGDTNGDGATVGDTNGVGDVDGDTDGDGAADGDTDGDGAVDGDTDGDGAADGDTDGDGAADGEVDGDDGREVDGDDGREVEEASKGDGGAVGDGDGSRNSGGDDTAAEPGAVDAAVFRDTPLAGARPLAQATPEPAFWRQPAGDPSVVRAADRWANADPSVDAWVPETEGGAAESRSAVSATAASAAAASPIANVRRRREEWRGRYMPAFCFLWRSVPVVLGAHGWGCGRLRARWQRIRTNARPGGSSSLRLGGGGSAALLSRGRGQGLL